MLATGARAFIPDIHGIDEVPYHTSDTILRSAHRPKHLVVLGGGFIAAELGHVFRSLGSRVTIINRGHRMLRMQDHDVSQRYTELAADRFDLVLGAHVERVYMTAEGVGLRISTANGDVVVEGDTLLVAAGRIPNGDDIGAEAGGVEVGADGRVIVDKYGRTTAAGVWALGDVNGRYQLKHMANGEAKVIQHNLLHPDDLRELDRRPAPHAVFGSPQIGSVGLTETQAIELGQPIAVISHPVRRRRVRLGVGRHHRLLQADRRSRDPHAARRARDRLPGLDAGAAARAGNAPRHHRRRDGNRPDLDPPCAVGGGRAGAAEADRCVRSALSLFSPASHSARVGTSPARLMMLDINPYRTGDTT